MLQLPYFWLIGTTLGASLPFVFERICKSWSKLEELRVAEALMEQEQNCQIAESKAQNAEYKMSRKYLADQGQDGSNSDTMEMLMELIALKPLVDKNREEIAKIAYFRKALTNGNNTVNQGVCRGYMNRVSYLQGLVAHNMKEIKHVMDKLTAKRLVPANQKVFQSYLDQEEELMAQQHEMFEKDRRERCSLVPCFPCLSGVVGSSGVAPASTSSAGPGPALASPVVGSSGVARACTSSGGPRPAAPASPLPCAAGPGAEAPAPPVELSSSPWEMQMQKAKISISGFVDLKEAIVREVTDEFKQHCCTPKDSGTQKRCEMQSQIVDLEELDIKPRTHSKEIEVFQRVCGCESEDTFSPKPANGSELLRVEGITTLPNLDLSCIGKASMVLEELHQAPSSSREFTEHGSSDWYPSPELLGIVQHLGALCLHLKLKGRALVAEVATAFVQKLIIQHRGLQVPVGPLLRHPVARACTSSGGPLPAAPASPLLCAAGPGAEAPEPPVELSTSPWEMQMQGE